MNVDWSIEKRFSNIENFAPQKRLSFDEENKNVFRLPYGIYIRGYKKLFYLWSLMNISYLLF